MQVPGGRDDGGCGRTQGWRPPAVTLVDGRIVRPPDGQSDVKAGPLASAVPARRAFRHGALRTVCQSLGSDVPPRLAMAGPVA
jgi:hypothetical protein